MLPELIAQQFDPNTTMNYLVIGYGAMWIIALGYVINLAIQQRNMRRDIELMKQLLEEEEAE